MHPVTIVAANRKDNSFLLITKILLHIDHVTVNDFSSPFVRNRLFFICIVANFYNNVNNFIYFL